MKKDQSLHIKVSAEEKRLLREEADRQGVNISKFLRQCVLKKAQSPAESSEKRVVRIVEEENSRKSNIIMLRVSDAEYVFIRKEAKAAGLSMSEYLRRKAKGEKIVVIEGLKEYVWQLRRIGVNLNQLTYLANQGQIFSVDLSAVKAELAEMWEHLLDFVKTQRK